MTRLFFDLLFLDTIPLRPAPARYEWDSDTIRVFAGEIFARCRGEDDFLSRLPKIIEHEYIHAEIRKVLGRDFFRCRKQRDIANKMLIEEMVVAKMQGIDLSPKHIPQLLAALYRQF